MSHWAIWPSSCSLSGKNDNPEHETVSLPHFSKREPQMLRAPLSLGNTDVFPFHNYCKLFKRGAAAPQPLWGLCFRARGQLKSAFQVTNIWAVYWLIWCFLGSRFISLNRDSLFPALIKTVTELWHQQDEHGWRVMIYKDCDLALLRPRLGQPEKDGGYSTMDTASLQPTCRSKKDR